MFGRNHSRASLTILGAVFGVAALAAGLSAQTARGDDNAEAPVTFTRDVLPILQANCQNCHRPNVTTGGSIAPLTLLSYEEARPWAKSIAKVVGEKTMPPWHASPEFHGVFENERGLTDAEIKKIQSWAKSGAPLGDPADAPAPVHFSNEEWKIGVPDLIVEMPETFVVEDGVADQYQNFVTELTEAQLPADRWIKAIEFKPGSDVVHHIIGYALDPGAAAHKDTAERADRSMIGGIAPGNEPDTFREGFGKQLRKGTKLVFAMHYHKEAGPGTARKDRSSVAFRFYAPGEEPKHKIITDAIGNHGFEIPPGNPNWEVGSARVFEKDILILSLMPHMHLRGKDATYTAFYPDGTSEKLLEVPRYDFGWQTSYELKEPKRIPAGTRLEVTMHFDNSKGNAANPDAAQSIRFGGPTTDEMMLGWLDYSVIDEAEGARVAAK